MSEEPTRLCISCKKPVKIDTHYINGATEFVGSPGYGSGFDSITQEKSADWPETPDYERGERLVNSGRRLSIVICDNCLATEAAQFITVTHSYTIGREITSTTPWSASDHPKRWLDYHAKKAGEKGKIHLLLDGRTLCGLLPSDTENSLTVVGAVGASQGKVTCDTCVDEWDAMK
jgi:hypothetical protein